MFCQIPMHNGKYQLMKYVYYLLLFDCRNVSYVVEASEEDGKKEAQHEGQDSNNSQQMLSQQELSDQKLSEQRFSDSQDDCFVSEQEPNGEVNRLLETRKQSRFSSIYGSESLSR